MFRVIKPKIELHIPSFLFKAKNMYHGYIIFNGGTPNPYLLGTEFQNYDTRKIRLYHPNTMVKPATKYFTK